VNVKAWEPLLSQSGTPTLEHGYIPPSCDLHPTDTQYASMLQRLYIPDLPLGLLPESLVQMPNTRAAPGLGEKHGILGCLQIIE
jgi:hypothetical protein